MSIHWEVKDDKKLFMTNSGSHDDNYYDGADYANMDRIGVVCGMKGFKGDLGSCKDVEILTGTTL